MFVAPASSPALLFAKLTEAFAVIFVGGSARDTYEIEIPNTKYLILLPMFAHKIRVEYEDNGERHPVPLKWLDSFAMRNFTNNPVFDDTLPVADGLIEAGTRVPLDRLQSAMDDWWRRKSYLPKTASLHLDPLS